jgi:hypothetical protein
LSQATGAAKRLQEVENGQEKAVKDAKAQAAKSRQEAEQLAERLKDSEAQMAELRSDHSAETDGWAGTKRDLEVMRTPFLGHFPLDSDKLHLISCHTALAMPRRLGQAVASLVTKSWYLGN